LCGQRFDYVCIAFVRGFIAYCNILWEYRHYRSAHIDRHVCAYSAFSIALDVYSPGGFSFD
jgi:hypothetical protein